MRVVCFWEDGVFFFLWAVFLLCFRLGASIESMAKVSFLEKSGGRIQVG